MNMQTVDRKPSLWFRMVIMLVSVTVLVGVIVGWNTFTAAQMKASMGTGGIPPATVSTTVARAQDWQESLSSVGTLRAFRGVDVSTEIAGLVRKVNFASGRDVDSGTVLLELTSDVERAQLEALKVAVELAKTTLARDREQFTVQAVSQATIDNDEADLRSKTAQMTQQQATLEKKTIRAPFGGRLGISTIAPGQYLNAGDKIVPLQAIDPIYVDFYLPQQQVSQVKRGQAVIITSDAWPDREFSGKISAINSTIDPSTRNIQVEATISNPQRDLLPGMYTKVSIQTGSAQRFITLPQSAILHNPYGEAVYLAQRPPPAKARAATSETPKASEAAKKETATTPELVASQVFVTLGPTRGDQVAIVKGIEEGATVVTSGQMKLRNGTPLVVNNAVTPRSDPNPKPQEQ
jgi:membrane fusion protein, multidrug efflux system